MGQKAKTNQLKPYLLTWNNNLSSNEINIYSQEIWNRFLLDHNVCTTSKSISKEKNQPQPILKLYRLTESYVHITASLFNYDLYGKSHVCMPNKNIVDTNVWKKYIKKVTDTSSIIQKMTPYNNNSINLVDRVWNRLRSNMVILEEKNISVISGHFEKVVCGILEDLEEDCSLLSSVNSVSCLNVKVRLNSMLPYLNAGKNDNNNDNNKPKKIRKVLKVRIKLNKHPS